MADPHGTNDTPADLWSFIASLGPPGPFKPFAVFNREGDQVEVYWDNAMAYAQPLGGGGGIVLMRAQDDDRVVGVIVEGARRLMSDESGEPRRIDRA